MTSMRYKCIYNEDDDAENKTVFISESVVALQPDCTNEHCLQDFTLAPMKKPICEHIDRIKEDIEMLQQDKAESLESSNKRALKEVNLELKKMYKHLNFVCNLDPITDDATPQALEDVLKHTKGVITAISTNPALINSLFFSSGKQSTTDLLLAGREGRSNRYNAATICCFAHKNAMPKAIEAADASGGLGLFKVIAEPNRVEMRNDSEDVQLDQNLLQIYKQKCLFFENVLFDGFDPDKLVTLHIGHCDWLNICHFENEFESQLKDGGKYADPIMRRYEGKISTHVVSLACNLFLLEEGPSGICYIDSEYVLIAIQMMKQLMDGLYTYCVGRRIEMIKFIFDLVVQHKDGLKMREIKKQCEGVHPFKDLPTDSKRIQEVVRFLASNNVLLRSRYGSYIKNPLV